LVDVFALVSMGGDEIKSFMVIINHLLRESVTPEFGYV